MKKLFLITLVISMVFSYVTAFAYGVTIDSVSIDCDMLFLSETVYLPMEDIANAMGKTTHWDEKTQTIFVNGIRLFPKKSSNITVYVDGEKKITGEGFIQDGKTYLPAHIAAAAFDLSATWDDNGGNVILKSNSPSLGSTDISEDKTYAIINKATGKAVSVSENALTTEDYTKSSGQEFKFIKTEFDGYYHIKSVSTGKNLDVNGHGTTAGVSIILWEQGTEDNQKFAAEAVPGGVIIYSRNRNLPLEPTSTGLIQNTKTLSSIQKWEIIPFGSEYKKEEIAVGEKLIVKNIPQKPAQEEKKEVFYTFSINSQTLTDTDGLKVTDTLGSANEMWTLNEIATDVYVITNLSTNKSLDVSARSLAEGGSIITYSTNSDANQRWILEKDTDGKYMIKSVHSSLYLTISQDGALIQAVKNPDLNQRWTMTPAQ